MIRFDHRDEYYIRTSDFPSLTNFTFLFEFEFLDEPVSSEGSDILQSLIYRRNTDDSQWLALYFQWDVSEGDSFLAMDSHGHALAFSSTQIDPSFGRQLVAWTKSGTTFTIWIEGVSVATYTDSSTITTETQMTFFAAPGGDTENFWDFNAGNFKVFNAALTGAQQLSERAEYRNVVQSNVYALYPLLNLATDQIDYSGNNRTLTPNGTLAEGSTVLPIPWKLEKAPTTRRQALTRAAVY